MQHPLLQQSAWLTPPGYRWQRVERTEFRMKRLHRFATDRWLEAKSASAARFWRAVQMRCEVKETSYKLVRSERA